MYFSELLPTLVVILVALLLLAQGIVAQHVSGRYIVVSQMILGWLKLTTVILQPLRFAAEGFRGLIYVLVVPLAITWGVCCFCHATSIDHELPLPQGIGLVYAWGLVPLTAMAIVADVFMAHKASNKYLDKRTLKHRVAYWCYQTTKNAFLVVYAALAIRSVLHEEKVIKIAAFWVGVPVDISPIADCFVYVYIDQYAND